LQDQAQKKSNISEDLDEEIHQTQKENVWEDSDEEILEVCGCKFCLCPCYSSESLNKITTGNSNLKSMTRRQVLMYINLSSFFILALYVFININLSGSNNYKGAYASTL
jgi:hypothetical protein